MSKKWRLAIFASGSGTNAQNLIEHFNKTFNKDIVLIVTNNPGAYVIERAKRLRVPCKIFDREDFREGKVLKQLEEKKVNFIILAGFLWLVPANIIRAFPGKIVNIHPALLPKYGGKGMYGHHVHDAVIRNGEKESGITIHYVNEEYDKGDVIFQAKCPVMPDDTPEILAQRIHQLEYRHFPTVVENLLDELEEKD
ncbi:MAG TPA: phosphoribosylglycinamide formyltransferase [Bacteroidetes bacterium]|nr:phosphoribosylglycinamide formyltransferase [Bacteroidota bacterium]